MTRPLTVQERVTVELVGLEGPQTPALTGLVAAIMFQFGQVLGSLQDARVHVVLDNAAAEDFVMRLTLTIPREALGV
jgi:hypothetical protein